MKWKIVVLVVLVFLLLSVGLNAWMIVYNGGSLRKIIRWEDTNYPCTQENFEILMENNYREGFGEGHKIGYSQGANAAATQCQNYVRNNKETICSDSGNGFWNIIGTIIGALL